MIGYDVKIVLGLAACDALEMQVLDDSARVVALTVPRCWCARCRRLIVKEFMLRQ